MELRHLRYFVALVDELHFSRAAARMNITQPPFSKQIRELEEAIPARLFSRDKRTVKLTQAGRVLLPYATQIFSLLEEGCRAAKRAHLGQIGKLSIGYTGTAASKLLPAILRTFRRDHADVELSLREMVPPEQLEALEKRVIDVAFMRPEAAVARFESRLFMREPLLLAVPIDHPLSNNKSVDVSTLKTEGFVTLPPRDGGLYREILALLKGANLEPRVLQTAMQLRSVIGLVSAGIGISIVPESAQRMNIAGVRYIPIRGKTCYTELVMVWRKDDDSSVLPPFLDAATKASGFARR